MGYFVVDRHCYDIQNLGIPYIVVGDHEISKSIPQVKIATRLLGKQVTEKAIQRFSHPVWMVCEQFKLTGTREIFLGYQDAVLSASQAPMTIAQEKINGEGVVESILRSGQKHFTIVTSDGGEKGIFADFEKHGIDPKNNPVVILGNKNRISHEDMKRSYVVHYDGNKMSTRAAELLLKLITGEEIQVYEEMEIWEDVNGLMNDG